MVNMPLTSRYRHSVITLDCCGEGGRSAGEGAHGQGSAGPGTEQGAYMVQGWLVQRQAVMPAPV